MGVIGFPDYLGYKNNPYFKGHFQGLPLVSKFGTLNWIEIERELQISGIWGAFQNIVLQN